MLGTPVTLNYKVDIAPTARQEKSRNPGTEPLQRGPVLFESAMYYFARLIRFITMHYKSRGTFRLRGSYTCALHAYAARRSGKLKPGKSTYLRKVLLKLRNML